MADVSYAPGTLTAVAGDRCWMLVDSTPDSPAVTWLWQQLGQRARPEAILMGLLGAGFAGATEFALLYQEDSGAQRLFCRGAVTATAHGAEARQIDGSGLLTWHEHAVPGDVRRIVLGVPPADSALRLPATAGVLLASCVIIDLTDAAVRRSTAPSDPPPAVTRPVSRPFPPIDTVPNADGAVPASTPPPAGVIRPDAGHRGPGAAMPAVPGHPDTATLTGPPSPADGVRPPSFVPPLPAPAVGPPPAEDEEYDFLWGATQARSVSDAAISPPGLIDAMPWGPGPAAPDEAAESSVTIKRGDLPGPGSWAAPPPDKIGPAVPALICPAGHVNPPSEARCRRCDAALPPDPVAVPRPVLGVLRLSGGDAISLDRDVIMGRNPKDDFTGADGEERPHVVRLASTDSDISRTHLRVTLDGWHVLVTDLNSTNGTLVTLPGREPEQLRPGQPMPIKPGTVVMLAEDIDFRYEVPE